MEIITQSKKVSVVICVKNSVKYIDACLNSVMDNDPFEIIVVDGNSTDGTLGVLGKYGSIKIISDQNKGLSSARKIGANVSVGDYILYVGPDNILPRDFISNLVLETQTKGLHASCVKTRVHKPITYWDAGQDFRWKCLAAEENQKDIVLGTPSLYKREIFKTENFSDANMGPNDDTDLCNRLLQRGYQLGQVDITVYEDGGVDLLSVWNRYKWYGTGDYHFYNLKKANWRWNRRIKSLTHPLRQFLRYTGKSFESWEIKYIPWLALVMVARYYGWFAMSWENKK